MIADPQRQEPRRPTSYQRRGSADGPLAQASESSGDPAEPVGKRFSSKMSGIDDGKDVGEAQAMTARGSC